MSHDKKTPVLFCTQIYESPDKNIRVHVWGYHMRKESAGWEDAPAGQMLPTTLQELITFSYAEDDASGVTRWDNPQSPAYLGRDYYPFALKNSQFDDDKNRRGMCAVAAPGDPHAESFPYSVFVLVASAKKNSLSTLDLISLERGDVRLDITLRGNLFSLHIPFMSDMRYPPRVLFEDYDSHTIQATVQSSHAGKFVGAGHWRVDSLNKVCQKRLDLRPVASFKFP